ncbi:hypothetical protein HDU87_008762 [Geranomyces variabilis]|uniref:Acyl-coenzyme A oxidase n=1 Tax=Geranomyces variabilis TaxID=109894 RepID=A0AAD5TD48_9FUNG|nr:hypothetical protein HDU87_008762 [Geranomyces variabilis]
MSSDVENNKPLWNNPNGLKPSGPLGRDVLAVERQKASFQVDVMTDYLHGGKEIAERHRQIAAVLASDEKLCKDDWHFQSRETKFKGAMMRINHLITLKKSHGWSEKEFWIAMEVLDEFGPTCLHSTMFIPTLEGQCDDEQRAEWLPLALNFNIIGCYAQTELGHGSNVQGLETTATYLPESQQFELHSPSLTSSKWWIGGLGRTATHAIVMARLLTKGKDFGPHPFFVPIRSTENHHTFKGVTVGDIGPKGCYQTVDNGFMLFDHYRIPRKNLLRRFCQVSADGTYTRSLSEKLSYGTLVFIRSVIVSTAYRSLARAATVATRYSAVRRQFVTREASQDDPFAPVTEHVETAVIDYPIQQSRLLVQIARAYALHFTGLAMDDMYTSLVSNLANNDVSNLAETHATSAGLKSLTTDMTMAGMEDMKRACGGHGLSKVSGLVEACQDYSPQVTYEGENYLMNQQTVRYLVKTYGDMARGPATANTRTVEYLRAATKPKYLQNRWKVSKAEDLCKDSQALAHLLAAFEQRAAALVAALAQDLATKNSTWNKSLVRIHRTAKAHCQLVMVQNFSRALNLPAEHPAAAPTPMIKDVLFKLGCLFALSMMVENIGEFLESGFMSIAQAQLVRTASDDVVAQLRPDAIALVDAFDFSDYHLNSALGRYDGNVYETMVQWVSRNPLNLEVNSPVIDGYEQFYKPMIQGPRPTGTETLQARL